MSWYKRMSEKNPPEKIRVAAARYNEHINNYVCEICGYDDCYPEIGEYGWLPSDRVDCPKCGPDAYVEIEGFDCRKPSIPNEEFLYG